MDAQRSAAKAQDSSVRLGFRGVPRAVRYALLILPPDGRWTAPGGRVLDALRRPRGHRRARGRVVRGGPHHGYALALIAVGDRGHGSRRRARRLAPGGGRAARCSRWPRWRWRSLVDLPDVHETGLIGRTYDAARAEPRCRPVPRARGRLRRAAGAALILMRATGRGVARASAEHAEHLSAASNAPAAGRASARRSKRRGAAPRAMSTFCAYAGQNVDRRDDRLAISTFCASPSRCRCDASCYRIPPVSRNAGPAPQCRKFVPPARPEAARRYQR